MYKIDYRQAQFLTREDYDETKLIFSLPVSAASWIRETYLKANRLILIVTVPFFKSIINNADITLFAYQNNEQLLEMHLDDTIYYDKDDLKYLWDLQRKQQSDSDSAENREDFIKHLTMLGADTELVSGIADFLYQQVDDIEMKVSLKVIRELFSTNYSFQFAKMLKSAYPGGDIFMTEHESYFVYVYKGIAYDINGVTNYNCQHLVASDPVLESVTSNLRKRETNATIRLPVKARVCVVNALNYEELNKLKDKIDTESGFADNTTNPTRVTAFDNVTVRSQAQDLNDAASKAFFGEQSIHEDPQDINDLL